MSNNFMSNNNNDYRNMYKPNYMSIFHTICSGKETRENLSRLRDCVKTIADEKLGKTRLINARNFCGNTPLMICCINGKKKFAEILLFCNTIYIDDFTFALCSENIEIARLLLKSDTLYPIKFKDTFIEDFFVHMNFNFLKFCLNTIPNIKVPRLKYIVSNSMYKNDLNMIVKYLIDKYPVETEYLNCLKSINLISIGSFHNELETLLRNKKKNDIQDTINIFAKHTPLCIDNIHHIISYVY